MDITQNEEHQVFDLMTEDEAKNSPDAEYDRPYIPRGLTPGRLESIEMTKSKNGREMTVWTFAIDGGYADGREVKTYIVLEQQYRILKMVTSLDLELESNGGIAFTDPKHRGAKCTLNIINSKQSGKNGEPFPEIKSVSSRQDEDDIPF